MGSPSTPMTDRRWLRLGPAAELLGVSINTLRRWSDAGKVACYRSAGGHRRFRRVDIETLLRDGTGGAASRRAARSSAGASEAATIAALEARTRDLQLLVEAGMEDSSHLSTDDVLQSVTRRLARLTHSPVADIYAVEGETLRALVSYDHGTFDRSWEGTTVRLRDYPCSTTAVRERRISLAASLDDPVLTPTGRASLEKWGYQSQLAAPIVARDAVIGILELSDYVPRDFGEHLELIEGLAHVAGRALGNAALFDEIRRRNVILHELVEFGALVTRAGDVTELLRIAAKRLVETLGAADCDVFTLEGDTLLSRVSYDRDGYDDDSVGHSLRVDDFPNVKVAIESQEIAVIASPDDPRIDTEERRVFAEWGFKSNLSLPLVVDGVVNGLIDIYDDEPGDFAEYVDFLKTVGQLLAGALGKARLLERLEESNNELRELVDSGLEFGSSLELEEVLYSVADRMRGLADAEECEISGLEGPDIVVRIAVGRDGRHDGEVGARRPIGARRAAQRAIETRQPVAVYDASADEGLSSEERALFLAAHHVASIRLPLIVRGEVIGLVALFDSHAREFPRVQLLQGLAQIAAQAMANARLLDEAMHRADVLRELVDLGALIWRTHDVDSLAHVVAQRLTTTIGAYCCEVFRLDDEALRCIVSYDTDDGFDEERRGAPLTQLDQFPSTVHAIEAIEPLVVASRDDPRLTATELAVYEQWGFNSELCIPVAVEGRVVGLIDVFDRVPRDYRAYLDFILSVGQMVAGAFENATLLERLGAINRELETLVHSGLEFGSTLDLDQVLASVASRIYGEAEVACCEIAIIEDDELRALVSVDERGADAAFPGITYAIADLETAQAVIDSGEPLAIADVRSDPRVSAFERAEWQSFGYVSTLRLPLLFGGRVAGFVSLFDTRPREFAHVELLRGLAQVAAQAVANATLFRRLDESSRRLAVVNDASLQLSSTLELRDILLSTANRLCEIGSAPTCDIYLLSGADLLCVASMKCGEIAEDWEGTVTPLDNWAAVELAVSGRTVVQLSSLEDPRRNATEIEELRRSGYEAELIVPLVAKGRVIGAADLLDFEQRPFSTDAVATVEAVCRAAALAIDNANLFEAVQLRRRETELLNAIARRTTSSLRLDEIAGATTDELRQIIAFERADLVLISTADQLETIYSSTAHSGGLGPRTVTPEQRDALETIRRDRVVVWEAGATPSFDGRAGSAETDAGASIALLRDEELIGVLDLAGPAPHVFASVDRHLLERVGTHLSLAINNARLYDEIKRMHLGNLKALSSALNAKDYYTLGHAARVGAYMVLLGHELGWSEETTHAGRRGGLSARHRQDRRLRPRPAQAERPELARVGAHAPAPHLFGRHPATAVRRRSRARRAPPP